MSVRQFNNIQTPKIPRNNLNLSHSRLLSADPFYLYPTLVEDCIPGDVWNLSNEVLIRNNPLASPIMHEQNAFIHYFFVPYRLLWKDWEKFITGGVDGDFVANIPSLTDVMSSYPNAMTQVGGLIEYIYNQACDTNLSDMMKVPNAFPLQAYYMIWNEYYRDPNLMIDLREIGGTGADWSWLSNMDINGHIVGEYSNNTGFLKRCWQKDYFTSMLPWQQRGAVPAFNLFGSGSISVNPILNWIANGTGSANNGNLSVAAGALSQPFQFANSVDPNQINLFNTRFQSLLNQLNIDFTGAGLNADVHDMRFAFQVTKFLERNARTGHRYVEFLKAHFPASPNDDRLQRPEYIGGMKIPIVVSEVLQTAEASTVTESGVGSMYGHGVTADRERIGRYRVNEHGVLLGLLSIMPNAMYMQGVERMFLKESRYDFYFPEFMNLSEQAVYIEEIYNEGSPIVERTIGYQGHWDQYRFRRNTVHGLFKSDFAYWHMARKFSSPPTLNNDLVMPNESEIHDVTNGIKRVLQVPSEPMYLCHVGNLVSVVRPMPYVAEPGLIDHN